MPNIDAEGWYGSMERHFTGPMHLNEMHTRICDVIYM